ncbi:MAG: caspase family protein [Candidatus Hydrogenedentes bacterium]|nr:caspase family protein [Candidatus Hydrogenedentota bacterium]
MPDHAPHHSERLIVVVVAIDTFDDPEVLDLNCAVNDAESVVHALSSTHPSHRLLMRVLASPPRIEGALEPTRSNVLQAIEWAAAEARADDTLMLYFAGHGGLHQGRLFLLPKDGRWGVTGAGAPESALVFLDDMQSYFTDHPCARRVMFVDCCQDPLQQNNVPVPATGAVSQPANSRDLDMGNRFAAAQSQCAPQLRAEGWTVVLSCSPGERSLEDPHWGHHGIFSHFLAAGLCGEADLDRDSVVSLGELVQYLANRVPAQAAALLTESRENCPRDGGRHMAQQSQMPAVVWAGPAFVPLTRTIDEGRAPFSRDVLRVWPRFLRENLPYALPVQGMLRYGIGVLYGAVMAVTAGLALPFQAYGATLGVSLVLGALSGFLWHAAYGLIAASLQTRWHAGGYFAGGILLAWHGVVLVFLACCWAAAATLAAGEAVLASAGLNLFAVIAILVLFAFNSIQANASLACLAERNERVVLRRAFMQLEERWMLADLPNPIAMVSAHPRLVQYLALACSVGPFLHAVHAMLVQSETAQSGWPVFRDVLLLILIHWPVPWFGAGYHAIRAQLLPDR